MADGTPHDPNLGAHGTQRVEETAPDAGAHGTMRVEEAPASTGSHGTLRVEGAAPAPAPSTARGAERHPLGLLAPGARLCGEYVVVETFRAHERMLPGVYRCTAPDGRPVVVKVAALAYPPDPAIWSRLEGLTHPNVLDTLRTLACDGCYYEIQDFCDAGTLSDYLPTPGSPAGYFAEDARVRQLVREITDGLSYLHEQEIIHRDIKPQNIYLRRGPDGQPVAVVGDFDISSTLERTRTSRTTARAGGTWIYTAPESFPRFMDETGHIGAQITRAGDFYALGICLIELLVGTTSLHTCGLSDLYDFYLQGNRVAIPAGIPADLATLLGGLLIINRQARWGEAEVRRWLAHANTPDDIARIQRDTGFSMKRAARPYRIRALAAYDLPGLADLMLQEREIALDDLMSGDLLINWIGEQDTNVARDVRRLRELWRQDPPTALWCAVMSCDPRRGFRCADGTETHALAEWFRRTMALVRAKTLRARDALTDATLTGLQVWLHLKTDPQPEIAERVKGLAATPEALRLEELAYLLQPELPFSIDAGHRARTPAEVARLAYGQPADWKAGIPPVYHAALQRWQEGALDAWLRQHGLAELAAQSAQLRRRLEDRATAAFETLLRLLDPALPHVQIEIDRRVLALMHIIPMGVRRRFKIPYKVVGPGVPFGTFTLHTPTEEVSLQDTLVTLRGGAVTATIDIDQEPFDCDPHYFELRLDSSYTEIAGAKVFFRYRMLLPGALTAMYLGVGALLGALFLLLPRVMVEVFGLQGYAAAGAGGAGDMRSPFWNVLFAIAVIEGFLVRAIWGRAVLQAVEQRRFEESNVRTVRWLREHITEHMAVDQQSQGCAGCAIMGIVFAVLAFGPVMRALTIGLDWLFAFGGALHVSMPVQWAVAGALIGLPLGFWHIANLYGMQRWRLWLILLPLLLFVLAALLGASGGK